MLQLFINNDMIEHVLFLLCQIRIAFLKKAEYL